MLQAHVNCFQIEKKYLGIRKGLTVSLCGGMDSFGSFQGVDHDMEALMQ